MKQNILSKSKLLKGFQCPKSMMLAILHPELETDTDEAQERRFDDGSEVGERARKEFPGGVLIEGEYYDYQGFLNKTQGAINDGNKVLFEPGFQWRSFFFRADVLKKTNKGEWDLIEVKMSTKVKEVHLIDLAIQKNILLGAGEKVRKTYLMHLNSDCVYPDLSDLFIQEDVTKDVDAILADVKKTMLKLEKLVAAKKIPEQKIGPHCDDPYECSFKETCWKHVPNPSIFDIPKIKPWKYADEGIFSIKDLAKQELSKSVKLFVDCHLKQKRHIDPAKIEAELKAWKWPLTFIDFETISYPIPIMDGTSPYENIPFQLACSVWQNPKGKLEEFDFLDTEALDPREAMAKHLVDAIPSKGSVVAYFKGFEAGVMKNLGNLFPKYKKQLDSICERLVDPLPIIRNNVYDPAFGSSFSLKYVAPALLGKKASYKGMEVANGTDAQLAYIKIRDPKTNAQDRKKLTKALEEYCRKDTELMRQLVEWMMAKK